MVEEEELLIEIRTTEEAVLSTALGHQVPLAGFSRVLIRSLEGFPARYAKNRREFYEALALR